MHPCNIEITKLLQMADPIGTALTYKVTSPSMLYTTHPLIQWCKSHIRGLYMKTPGPDLSTISRDDFYDSWMLHKEEFLPRNSYKPPPYMYISKKGLSSPLSVRCFPNFNQNYLRLLSGHCLTPESTSRIIHPGYIPRPEIKRQFISKLLANRACHPRNPVPVIGQRTSIHTEMVPAGDIPKRQCFWV